jgi:hypothetical protein
MARSWGLTPSEFWGMTMAEILLEFETRRDRTEGDYAGSLTAGELDELRDWMNR